MNIVYETDRLVLKLLGPDRAEQTLAFQLRNRELFERCEPALPDNFYTLSYQRDILRQEQAAALRFASVRFYVFRKEAPDRIIGTVCLRDLLDAPYSCCELCYKFDRDFHHMGYAREAAEAALKIAFDDLKLHRVFARVAPDNDASIRLLETLSFAGEGLERESIFIQGKWTDLLRFSRICPREIILRYSGPSIQSG